MKLTAFLFLLGCLGVSAKGIAQQVTVKAKNAALRQVFTEIEQQTGYHFFYADEDLNAAKPVTLTAEKETLQNVLQRIFAGQPLNYSIVDKTVMVKKMPETEAPSDFYAGVPHRQLVIHGYVRDTADNPLEGASIVVKSGNVKGTTQEGQTDENGNIILSQLQDDETIEVKFTGYETKEIHLGNRKIIDVILRASTNSLDEVQIIAYGTTTKRLNTGSVGHVSADEIARQPVTNVLQALQGRVPGLLVKQTAGYGSAPFSVQIRGQNSIVFSSDPLYVIDGVPMIAGAGDTRNLGLDQNFIVSNIGQSPIFSINPSDIESIDVLKDADATAIYGSQGANGVILITTKKGTPGKTKVEFNVYNGAGKVTRLPKLLNTQQYLEIREEAYKNDNITPNVSNAPDLLKWDPNSYTDWQKVLVGNTAHTTDAEGSVSGGDTYTQYRISGGYHDETNVTTASGSDRRGSFNVNLNNHSRDNKFSVAFTGSFSHAHTNMISLDNSLTILPPNAPPIFDKNGNLDFTDWGYFSLGLFGASGSNPFGILLQPYNSGTDNLQAHLQLQYKPINNLTLRLSGGYSDLDNSQTYVKPKKSMDPALNPTSSTIFGSNGVKTWIIEPQAEYNKQISRGRLDVLLGGTFQSTLTTGSQIYGTNFSNEALLLNLQSAQSVTIYGYTHTPYRYDAIFGRINYNWDSKYLVDLTARRDGSSRFGPGNQFGNFGAVGAGWIFSEESFMKHSMPFINYGKIRASYGSTGSANIGDYQYLSQWKPNTNAYENTSTLSPAAHYNPDYGWEVNKKLEIALEMAFFQNRIQTTFSWFRNRSSNQLVAMPLPAYTGFTSVTANLPATVQNTGWEATLVTTNIQSKDFKWNTSFNITIPRNKLIDFPGLASSSYATKYEIGKSLSLQQKLHFEGVDPQTGNPIFEDVNGDGKITTTGASNDLRGLYNLDPSFYGGFNNEIRYKNWDLSFFFQFTKQKGTLYYYSIGEPGTINNQSVNILNRWQKPGDITNVPKVSTIISTDWINFSSNSDAAITDASFARLQNLSLSYTLPNKWTKHYHSQYTRLYIQGQNLLTITKYKGADPDTQSLTAIPPVKFLTAGIQITF